jgi:hypothetical protein
MSNNRQWQQVAIGFAVGTVVVCLSWPAGAKDFYHSADTAADWSISLSELLRVVQFYNSDGYHVDSNTEDGYTPGPDSKADAPPHASDYAPQDWKVNLSELLRLIQILNSRGYDFAGTTEDKYEPNPWYAPVEDDSDGDGLTDTEEAALGMDPDNPDEDGDGFPDGRALALACASKMFSIVSGPCPIEDPDQWIATPSIEEDLASVTECSICDCETTPAACFWVHPDTGTRVDLKWCAWFDLCNMRDVYANATSMYDFWTHLVPVAMIEDAAIIFLQNGSFSYYDLSCSGDLNWSWDPAALRRLDVLFLVNWLFPEGGK